MKKERGITLIALIITIIILLILAMVTIRILMNQGIIKHAQNATTAYNDAQNNETEYLTYAEGEMDKYAGSDGSGKSNQDFELLKRYFLKENGEGKSYGDVFLYKEIRVNRGGRVQIVNQRTDTFKNDESSIKNAETEIQLLQNSNDGFIIKYRDKFYKVIANENTEQITNVIKWDEPIIMCRGLSRETEFDVFTNRVDIYYNKNIQPWTEIEIKVMSNNKEIEKGSVEDNDGEVYITYPIDTLENCKVIVSGRKDGQIRQTEYQPTIEMIRLDR